MKLTIININPIIVPLIILILTINSCRGQSNNQTANTIKMEEEKPQEQQLQTIEELPFHDFRKMLELAKADHGKRYRIGKHELCPEKRLILRSVMFGTATKDAVDYFPDYSLKYGIDTMIIFAGWAFFDKSDLNIDWQKVKLLYYSYSYSEFTDGYTLYHFEYGNVSSKGKYDKNSYTPNVEESRIKYNLYGVNELTENFYIQNGELYYGSYGQNDEDEEGGYTQYKIVEKYDVPNLRIIVSENGRETDYITDGKQVIYGGATGGNLHKTIAGEEYIITQELMLEGIDLPSVRVLGKNILMDKKALYYGTDIIPFAELGDFKFILREM